MQFNVISEIYFENYTTTAINSSYSYKIGCRMETVRRNLEVPQHGCKDQYAGWTLELLDFLTSPSSDISSRAKHFGNRQEKAFLTRSSLNSPLLLFKMVETSNAVGATLYRPFCTFPAVKFITTHTHIHTHTQTTQFTFTDTSYSCHSVSTHVRTSQHGV